MIGHPPSTPDPQAAPDPLGTPDATTGHPAVDAALRELDDLTGAAPAEQLPAFEAVHHVLQQTLGTIDES